MVARASAYFSVCFVQENKWGGKKKKKKKRKGGGLAGGVSAYAHWPGAIKPFPVGATVVLG